MAKKNKKNQTGGGGIFKFMFIILISIFIVFSIMNIIYKFNCEGAKNYITNFVDNNRGGLCAAVKEILEYLNI
tara:strand:- start:647 stop:865 length:219 start_codon:yes stop_codon:yes gene_type:complete